jgi:serine/threonine protein kinase
LEKALPGKGPPTKRTELNRAFRYLRGDASDLAPYDDAVEPASAPIRIKPNRVGSCAVFPLEHEAPMTLSGHAQDLAGIGPATAKATATLQLIVDSGPLNLKGDDPFKALSEALHNWKDVAASTIINAITDELRRGALIETASVSQWIRAHDDDPAAVVHCITTVPPDQIAILQLWSKAGSQKLVFLANWQIAQREVVLKRFIDPEAAKQLIPRELIAHALSTKHPNIIETHLMNNHYGEPFLVERRLQDVLRDDWDPRGIAELANLLRDIASALAFLEEGGYVHGDVKPDNIGYQDGRYILLDFGICRPLDSFASVPTPTGSLRTRAPELLSHDGGAHTYSSDLWALGATVYLGAAKRFPLIDSTERVPRVSDPDNRGPFEELLRTRVDTQYDQWVDLAQIPDPLRPILRRLLDRDPSKRGKAVEVVRYCEYELAAFVRRSEDVGRFSPSQEVQQLSDYLPGKETLALMPHSEKHKLKMKLHDLKMSKGLTDNQQHSIKELEARLG